MHTPFTNLDFWLGSSRYKKYFFCQCYQNYLRRLLLRFFRWVAGGFCCTPKRWGRGQGWCTSTPKTWGVFSEILATASRLNTLYGLETLYVQISRHGRIIKSFEAYPTFLTYSLRHKCRIFTLFCNFWLYGVS